MLYYLFEYINKLYEPPGFDIFRFLTFRSALAAITGLFLALYVGPKVIRLLTKNQIGEAKKEDGPKFHWSKAGTPTMGGVIILLSVLIPVLLWADIKNTYVILITVGTLWLGGVGFLDDYLKVVKQYPNGLIVKIQAVRAGYNWIGSWFSNLFFSGVRRHQYPYYCSVS